MLPPTAELEVGHLGLMEQGLLAMLVALQVVLLEPPMVRVMGPLAMPRAQSEDLGRHHCHLQHNDTHVYNRSGEQVCCMLGHKHFPPLARLMMVRLSLEVCWSIWLRWTREL